VRDLTASLWFSVFCNSSLLKLLLTFINVQHDLLDHLPDWKFEIMERTMLYPLKPRCFRPGKAGTSKNSLGRRLLLS
jgi:hypothetical protein